MNSGGYGRKCPSQPFGAPEREVHRRRYRDRGGSAETEEPLQAAYPDAILLAAAKGDGATAFVTNDHGFLQGEGGHRDHRGLGRSPQGEMMAQDLPNTALRSRTSSLRRITLAFCTVVLL